MPNVDLIIPSYPAFKNYQKISLPIYRWKIHWFPVWYYQKDLKNLGINVRFLNILNLKFHKLSKIVGIDSKAISSLGKNYSHYRGYKRKFGLSFIKKLRKEVDYLLWFDNNDSSGSTHFELLPYIDRYFKRALLKDRSLYTKTFYKNRIYTDYYARNYNLDKNFKFLKAVPLDPKYQHKIGLFWNLALSDYRDISNLTRFLCGFSKKMKLKFQKPSINRKIIFSANYNVKFSSDLISFQRKQLLKNLFKKYTFNDNVSLGYIPKKKYIKTIKQSKAIFSPFGFGEVCLRDFETFIAGAALIKPDMNHLETWPHLYKKKETYISLPWKIEEWENIIQEILADDELLFKIARNGQNLYKEIWTKEGKDDFCNRFIEIITPK